MQCCRAFATWLGCVGLGSIIQAHAIPSIKPTSAVLRTYIFIMSHSLNGLVLIRNSSFSDLFVTAVAPGVYHTCAVGIDGSVWCWGGNGNGQLGVGSDVGQTNSPMAVYLGAGRNREGHSTIAL